MTADDWHIPSTVLELYVHNISGIKSLKGSTNNFVLTSFLAAITSATNPLTPLTKHTSSPVCHLSFGYIIHHTRQTIFSTVSSRPSARLVMSIAYTAFRQSTRPSSSLSIIRPCFASSSRLTLSHRFNSRLAQPSSQPSGFEGIPAAAYVTPIEGKGKEKALDPLGSRPRASIKSKKSAISMVSSLPNL